MNAIATADLDKLAQGFRRLLNNLPSNESYGPEDVVAIIADIERLKAGWRPTDDDLTEAAHIDGWAVQGDDGQEILSGVISRHPWRPWTRVRSTTSGVVLADRHLRWARTIGRLYELGSPESDEHAGRLGSLRVI